MATSPDSQILKTIRRLGLVRASDLMAHGISRGRLYRLLRNGLVERQARGIYTFGAHLKWTWAIALGYIASIWVHFLVNGALFDGMPVP